MHILLFRWHEGRTYFYGVFLICVHIMLMLQQDVPSPLQDGNGAIYPMAKDCLEGIRDPMWLDLPPVRCLNVRVQSLSNTGANMKNRAAIIALAVQVL